MEDRGMTNGTSKNQTEEGRLEGVTPDSLLSIPIEAARSHLSNLSPENRLTWAHEEFGPNFVITTSFGIQSAVLLHMLHCLKNGAQIPVIWVDTGYLPKETYFYASQLTKQLGLNIKVAQSEISPARMEALYGRLWETGSEKDLEKYHLLRKVKPLEQKLDELKVQCWASGVRSSQTTLRSQMTLLDDMRGRLSLRPILDWTPKDVFYYMKENNLPQHPLFEKGFSTVGDWHSSAPDNDQATGRNTRFGGLKQECGIHLPGQLGEGI